ncbi:MAG: PQQ-like beta-propeller repeat protein [Planctomycetia bacterium]|nr:PQQ-like beta-propeller repeat protein [Planctomycetia bacterium]
MKPTFFFLPSRFILLNFILFFVLFSTSIISAGDWTGWRGANRDGIAHESGLLRNWGEEDPPLLWKNTSVGSSMNGMTVVGTMTYTIGVKSGVECVFCIENNTGKTIWARPIGKAVAKTSYPMSRSTPTFYRNMLYVLSSSGNLVCLNSSNGYVTWTRNLIATAGGVLPRGGYCESPYVDGKWVLVTPGGPNATIVAINRHNGQNVRNGSAPWVAKAGIPAGYSSIIKASFGKEHQYVQFTGAGVIGVKVRGGDVRWKYEKTAHPSGVNVSPPIWFGQTVLTSSAEGTAVIWVQKAGSTYNTEEVWFNEDIKIPTGDIIKVNDNVFACTSEHGLICFDYKTGKINWSDDSLFPEEEEKSSKSSKKTRTSKSTALMDFPSMMTADPTEWFLGFLQHYPSENLLAQAQRLPVLPTPPSMKIPPATRRSSQKSKRAAPPAIPTKMASMTYAEGLLYVRTSAGELALIEASASGFKLRGRFSFPQMKKGYAVTPVVSNGLLFLREGGSIFCFDLHDVSSKNNTKTDDNKNDNKKPLPGMPQTPKTNIRKPPRVG